MHPSKCKVGMKVYFGRVRGEKTLGEVIKINPTKAKVKILEDRGNGQGCEPGSIWGVPYSMMEPKDNEPSVRLQRGPDGKVFGTLIPATPSGIMFQVYYLAHSQGHYSYSYVYEKRIISVISHEEPRIFSKNQFPDKNIVQFNRMDENGGVDDVYCDTKFPQIPLRRLSDRESVE